MDCRVNREVEAIGDAKEVMGAAGRTARRPKLDVRAMSDLAEAMVYTARQWQGWLVGR